VGNVTFTQRQTSYRSELLAAFKNKPEVIFFDPLYKLNEGVENAAEDMRTILAAFDMVAEETGAAIVYVHHDTKGNPGDRDIRDRGAGSNVLGRDYDACMTLTSHAQEDEAIVVDVLLRNYKPQPGTT
jgi:RecA-family ATPase